MNAELNSKEYRDAFVAEALSTGIAFQIRALRTKMGWSQMDLGQRSAKAQNVISRLENPDYGKYTVTTLLDIAAAFDVALSVRFVSFRQFSKLLENVSPEVLAVPSFTEESNRPVLLNEQGGCLAKPRIPGGDIPVDASSYANGRKSISGAQAAMETQGQRNVSTLSRAA